VVSYRIYRSTTSGDSYGLEASAITGQTYTDSSVQSEVTYYYVATGVDQQGQESPYSGEVKAVIP
jgi:fibronectin type 3 domain-containing protein